MKILIIGGTRFVGRHLVDAALKRGHTITLFNRGKSNPDLHQQNPAIEIIQGDRATDLGKLAGRSWDAVIDTCGYLPRLVRLSAQALKNSTNRYVFISSISVYSETAKIGIDENDALGKIDDETTEEITGDTYGPLKVLCEQVVEQEFANRALIIRPGLIIGPHDPTDRFTYWPVRVARGGEILAPENPRVPVQFIDGRDLAEFSLMLIEAQENGIFNATGPTHELSIGEMLETCKQVSASQAHFTWASVEFLTENKVEPWSDLPVWVPDTLEDAGFSRVSIAKALQAGLTFRPLAETIRDTLSWAQTLPETHTWLSGLSAERETELLAKLHQV